MTPARRAASIALTAALASTLARAWLSHRYPGFHTGDDVEIAEEAFRRALGLIHGPWDIRSLLIPDLFVAPFVKLAHLIGVRDSLALAEIARLPFVALAGVNVYLLFLLGRRWFDDTTGAVAAVLYATHWIPLVYASSLYPRTVAVTCILAAAIVLDERSAWRALVAGILAALALTARYSEAIFFASLLVIAPRGQRRALTAGFVFGAIAFVGIYDWLTWGAPFSSVIAFAELVFVRRDASSVVVFQPPWWYLTNLPHWLALTALPFVIVGVGARVGARIEGKPEAGVGARTQLRRFAAMVVLPLVVFSAVFHKELRYLQVIIPFALLFAAHGFEIWRHQPNRRKLAIALLILSIPLGLARVRGVERRSTNAVHAARWMATQHPRAVMLPQAWAYGGRLFLGNAPSINDPGAPPTPRQLREILPTVDCAALYSSDAASGLEAIVRANGFTTRIEFAGRGGRAVTVYCR